MLAELGMPCLRVAVAVTVEEDDCFWEVVVVVDDVLEVRVGFFAFVFRDRERCAGVVDGVDCVLPSD